jgi:hypothetical protein
MAHIPYIQRYYRRFANKPNCIHIKFHGSILFTKWPQQVQHATEIHKQYIFSISETIVDFTQRFTEALCKLFKCYKYIHTYTIWFMCTIQKPLKRIRSHILATENLTRELKLCVTRHHFRPIRISQLHSYRQKHGK